jgi:hypothetical protein
MHPIEEGLVYIECIHALSGHELHHMQSRIARLKNHANQASQAPVQSTTAPAADSKVRSCVPIVDVAIINDWYALFS